MSVIQWERYPTVAQQSRARTWLTIQANLELAPNTIEAYGGALEDYLTLSQRVAVVPETASREQSPHTSTISPPDHIRSRPIVPTHLPTQGWRMPRSSSA